MYLYCNATSTVSTASYFTVTTNFYTPYPNTSVAVEAFDNKMEKIILNAAMQMNHFPNWQWENLKLIEIKLPRVKTIDSYPVA